jgi:hypothetical protein
MSDVKKQLTEQGIGSLQAPSPADNCRAELPRLMRDLQRANVAAAEPFAVR